MKRDATTGEVIKGVWGSAAGVVTSGVKAAWQARAAVVVAVAVQAIIILYLAINMTWWETLVLGVPICWLTGRVIRRALQRFLNHTSQP